MNLNRYEEQKDACRAFPDPQREELARGPKLNFQILDCQERMARDTRRETTEYGARQPEELKPLRLNP
jgi:hypothetical protein